jgi:hypothetical protein
MKIHLHGLPALCVVCWLSLSGVRADDKVEKQGQWIQLFNGKDLHGWVPKFVGYDLGVNYKNTFLVKDGLLTVCYDNYKQWQDNFGHLFYKGEFSHYILRVEYRFVGSQLKNAPDWAYRNSGIMFHGQSAASMGKDQHFPASIEAQLLGGHPGGKSKRNTLDLYTPGTYVCQQQPSDKLHHIKSTGPTIDDDRWVTVEIEVHGGDIVRHKIGGQVVLEYQQPRLDDGSPLAKGTISLQAESHPIQFRKIELKLVGQ